MDINSLWLRWPSPSASKIWNTVLTKCGLNFWPVHTNTALWKSSEQNIYYKAKIKKRFVSRTRLTVRKRFWVICDAISFSFFFGYRKSWPEVPILFQNLCLELVYTFKWTKSVARLWKNQICEWTLKKKKKKKKSPYPPTHRWNGGSGAGNKHIFKDGLTYLYYRYKWVSDCCF